MHGAVIWDTTTSRVVRRFTADTGAERVAWSPNGRILAAGLRRFHPGEYITYVPEEYPSIVLWDAVAGTTVATLTLTAGGEASATIDMAFSADGRLFAAASGGDAANTNVVVWNTNTWQQVGLLAVRAEEALAFSPDGRFLATAGALVQFWDTRTFREVTAIDPGGTLVTAIAFSPDGRTLAVGRFDGVIQVYDAPQ